MELNSILYPVEIKACNGKCDDEQCHCSQFFYPQDDMIKRLRSGNINIDNAMLVTNPVIA